MNYITKKESKELNVIAFFLGLLTGIAAMSFYEIAKNGFKITKDK